MPVARFRVLGLALFAKTAAILGHIRAAHIPAKNVTKIVINISI